MIIYARKRPVLVSAIKWTGKNLREIIGFTGLHESMSSRLISDEMRWDDYERLVERDGLKIFTLEGSHMAQIGDFIIRGVKGEFYPCKPDIFQQTYRRVATPKSKKIGKLKTTAAVCKNCSPVGKGL